jgi:DNA-binding GntR family transcriptional regulator
MTAISKATFNLSGLENRPLRQQIADLLQDAILDGELKPGQALVETDIATRLGVSRAPVREALQILANRNLVETVPYRGTTVRKLSKVDIEEAYSLRTVLETFAIRRIIAGDPEAAVTELRAICNNMQRVAAAEDWRTLVAEDDRFHRTMISHARHGLLMTMWLELNIRVRQIMALRNLQNLDIMQIFYNHVPIVQAVADRDEGEAIRLIQAHIASAADLMIDREGMVDPSET